MTTELVDAALEMYRTVSGNKDCTITDVYRKVSSQVAKETISFGGNNMGGKVPIDSPPETKPLNVAEDSK